MTEEKVGSVYKSSSISEASAWIDAKHAEIKKLKQVLANREMQKEFTIWNLIHSIMACDSKIKYSLKYDDRNLNL